MPVLPATPILTVTDTLQNVVGMSVVGPDFEKLKRFNIEELRQTPTAADEKSSAPIKIVEDE
jgi:tRNA acetyltransferase TAN1